MSPPKTAAQRKASERQRHRDAGRKPLQVWVHPDDHPPIKALAEKLRKRREKESK